MIEVLLGLSCMGVAMLGYSHSLVSTSASTQTVRGSAVAERAAKRMLETLQDTDLSTVYALYNQSDGDDPGGPGTAPGDGFEVEGLDPLEDDPDGRVGRIVFPGGGGPLREDAWMPALGMPRDLDGDGEVDDEDHSEDYGLLPVQVVVEWRGRTGPCSLSFKTILADL